MWIQSAKQVLTMVNQHLSITFKAATLKYFIGMRRGTATLYFTSFRQHLTFSGYSLSLGAAEENDREQ